jgi:hypothetical protein
MLRLAVGFRANDNLKSPGGNLVNPLTLQPKEQDKPHK